MSDSVLVSYAQNAEDVVLGRVLKDREAGFYIDVGACHPVDDSVTLHFFKRGWRGINIEPDRELHALLVEHRPTDINLCVAIGGKRGRVDFYPTDTRGHGTLNLDVAAGRTNGRHSERVPMMPLSDVIDCYGPDDGCIDFLKIDVEGYELEAIASVDWARYRPVIVVVEAVDEDGTPTHAAWEPLLLAAGYQFGLFDGLNRFYCREEDAGRLLTRLAAPANVFDGWMRATEMQALQAVTQEQSAAANVERRAAEQKLLCDIALEESAAATRRVEVLTSDLEQCRFETSIVKSRCEVLEVEIARSRDAAAAALRREEAAEAAMALLEMKAGYRLSEAPAAEPNVLNAIYASTSWRVTAPLRWLGRCIQGIRRRATQALPAHR